jgi:hypothetical protein
VCLFITVIFVANLSLVGDLGVGFLAAPMGALVLAEAAVAIRPTRRRLARADQLVLVTVGAFLALGLVGVIASAM